MRKLTLFGESGGQNSTVVLTDRTAMTESAAMTLWLADQAGRFDLVPRPDEP